MADRVLPIAEVARKVAPIFAREILRQEALKKQAAAEKRSAREVAA